MKSAKTPPRKTHLSLLLLLLVRPYWGEGGRKRAGRTRQMCNTELYLAKSLLVSAMPVPPAELLDWMPVGPGQLLNPWMLYSISTGQETSVMQLPRGRGDSYSSWPFPEAGWLESTYSSPSSPDRLVPTSAQPFPH